MVSKENLNENITLNELIKRVNKSDISTIIEVIIKLLAVIRDPKSSAKDLKVIIERDLPLTARLLKRANSAYYGFRREISSIQEAIINIGFNTVKELALTQKFGELFQKDKIFMEYSRAALWKHSVAVALCCKSICMKEFREPGENIYTIGLLHNIGIIIEDQFLYNNFKQALKLSSKDRCNLQYAEKNILGFDHMDIGRQIADDWDFPFELVDAIGNHHEPDRGDDKFKKNTLILYISDYFCQRNNIGYCDAPYENKSLSAKYLKELNIQEEAMDIIIEDVQEEIQKMKKGGWFQNE